MKKLILIYTLLLTNYLYAQNNCSVVSTISNTNVAQGSSFSITYNFNFYLNNSKPVCTLQYNASNFQLNTNPIGLINNFDVISTTPGLIILRYNGSESSGLITQESTVNFTSISCYGGEISMRVDNCTPCNSCTASHNINVDNILARPNFIFSHFKGTECIGGTAIYKMTVNGANNTLIMVNIGSSLVFQKLYNSTGIELTPTTDPNGIIDWNKTRDGIEVFYLKVKMPCFSNENQINISYGISINSTCGAQPESYNSVYTKAISNCSDECVFDSALVKKTHDEFPLRYAPLCDGCNYHYYNIRIENIGNSENNIHSIKVIDDIPAGLIQSNSNDPTVLTEAPKCIVYDWLDNQTSYSFSSSSLDFPNSNAQCNPPNTYSTNPSIIQKNFSPTSDAFIPPLGRMVITIPYLIKPTVPFSTTTSPVNINNRAKVDFKIGNENYYQTVGDTSEVQRKDSLLNIRKLIKKSTSQNYSTNTEVNFGDEIDVLIIVSNYGLNHARGLSILDSFTNIPLVSSPYSFEMSLDGISYSTLLGYLNTIPVSAYSSISPFVFQNYFQPNRFYIKNINLDRATCKTSQHLYIKYKLRVPSTDEPCSFQYNNTAFLKNSLDVELRSNSASFFAKITPSVIQSLKVKCVQDSTRNYFTNGDRPNYISGTRLEYLYKIVNTSPTDDYPNFRIIGNLPNLNDKSILNQTVNKFTDPNLGSSFGSLMNVDNLTVKYNQTLYDYNLVPHSNPFSAARPTGTNLEFGFGTILTDANIDRNYLLESTPEYNSNSMGFHNVIFLSNPVFKHGDSIIIKFQGTIPPCPNNSNLITSFAFQTNKVGCAAFQGEFGLNVYNNNVNCFGQTINDECENIQIGYKAIKTDSGAEISLTPITYSGPSPTTFMNTVDSIDILVLSPYRNSGGSSINRVLDYRIKNIISNTTGMISSTTLSIGAKQFSIRKNGAFNDLGLLKFSLESSPSLTIKHTIPVQVTIYIDNCKKCVKLIEIPFSIF